MYYVAWKSSRVWQYYGSGNRGSNTRDLFCLFLFYLSTRRNSGLYRYRVISSDSKLPTGSWWYRTSPFSTYRGVFNCGNGICSSGWPWPTAPAGRSIELLVCNFHRKSSNMFFFSIFVRVFLDVSSGRKSFRFPQVVFKILPSELNISHIALSTK